MNQINDAALHREYTWDGSQKIAIERCCDMQDRVVAVTGVAGTGKTTIIREVYYELTKAGYSVALCAPTGKAAKRIHEATGIPAMTMHRLLEYPYPGEIDPLTGKALSQSDPKRDRANPLDYNVVLADEYAMVNLEVHRNLVAALPRGGRLCMFGDVNQLRPIEPNNRVDAESPFQAALRRFEGVVLDTIHRQQEGSGIAHNGARILKGQVPQRKDDFVLQITSRPTETITNHVMDMLEAGVNYGTNMGQIISTTKQSWVGTYKLNALLQDLLNPLPRNTRIALPRHTWDDRTPITVGVGDKVIWTRNAYDLRDFVDRYYDGDPENGFIPTPPEKMIMNGESGVVTRIQPDGSISIDVGDRVVEVPSGNELLDKNNRVINVDPRRDMDLGFVITTHKAQGSEWSHIVYVLNNSAMYMQSRHNFYTAISRASKHVTVISDQRSLQNSVTQTMSVGERTNKA